MMSTLRHALLVGLTLVSVAYCSSDSLVFSSSPSAVGSGSSGETTSSAGVGGTTATDATSSGANGGSSGNLSGTATGGVGGAGGCVPLLCQAKLYLCANCLDDDADGKIDSEDPYCLGPCDNTEDRLDLGIPGAGNAPCKRDCYFDKDSGAGNDGCARDLCCDPLSPDAIDCA